MGIYERQRHMLANAGMWGDHPFRPHDDAPLAAVAPPVTAVPAAAVDVAGAETEVKFSSRMVVSNY